MRAFCLGVHLNSPIISTCSPIDKFKPKRSFWSGFAHYDPFYIPCITDYSFHTFVGAFFVHCVEIEHSASSWLVLSWPFTKKLWFGGAHKNFHLIYFLIVSGKLAFVIYEYLFLGFSVTLLLGAFWSSIRSLVLQQHLHPQYQKL